MLITVNSAGVGDNLATVDFIFFSKLFLILLFQKKGRHKRQLMSSVLLFPFTNEKE